MKTAKLNLNVFKLGAVCAVAFALAAVPAVLAADADMGTRIVDYFRRKQNLPPEVGGSLTDIKDSPIKGAKSATIELMKGAQKQTVQVLMSEDGRYVVFGDIEDVTSDPFAEKVKKITMKDQPTRGGKDAKVTIVEFSDFQCPYCARAHATLTDQVEKEYGDKIKVVYKNYPLPFHPWAQPAAIAGECVFEQSPTAFWKLYDFYFNNQKDMTPDNVKDKALEALKDEKISKDKFTQCFDGKKTLDKVQADMAEGQAVGVNGTPAFLINGRTISGAQPFEAFKAVIDDELQRASGKKS